MLPSGGAAGIATSVVKQHQADQDIFAALTDFVTDVQREASTGGRPGPGRSRGQRALTRAPQCPDRRRGHRRGGGARDLLHRPPRPPAPAAGAQGGQAGRPGRPDRAQHPAHRSGHRRRHPGQPRSGAGAGRGAGRLRARHRGAGRRAAAPGHGRGQPGHRRGPVPPGQRRGPRGRPAPARPAPVVLFRPAARHVGDRRLLDAAGRRARPHRPGLLRRRAQAGARHRARDAQGGGSTAPQSTTSTPASLPRTGAVTASVPACSPGSCSERFFRPRSSTPTVIPVAETTAAATSEAATAADFGGGDFGGGDYGGGDFGGGDFGGGGDFS